MLSKFYPMTAGLSDWASDQRKTKSPCSERVRECSLEHRKNRVSMVGQAPAPLTPWDRFVVKAKQDPLVPIGAAATIGFLLSGEFETPSNIGVHRQ